jgi:hypothetical protein
MAIFFGLIVFAVVFMFMEYHLNVKPMFDQIIDNQIVIDKTLKRMQDNQIIIDVKLDTLRKQDAN